jgi:hypothetical protein
MTAYTPSQLWRFHNLGEELEIAPDPDITESKAKADLDAKAKPPAKPKASEEK